MELSQISPENTEIKNIIYNASETANETTLINNTTNNQTGLNNDSDSKIFSLEGECLIEDLDITNDDSQNPFQELTDFEELIDLTRDSNDIEETIKCIKEYENILTPEVCINDVEDVLNLDDIFKDILDNDTHCNDLDVKTTTDSKENNEVKVPNTVKTLEAMADSNEHLLQTPESPDTDNPNSITPTDKDVIFKEQKPGITFTDEDTQSISSDGYNSSDFEFITETEAKMDGYVINFNQNETKNEIAGKSTDEDESSQSDECRDYASQIINENRHLTDNAHEKYSKYYKNNNASIAENRCNPIRNFLDVGAGPSGSNGPIYDYSDRSYRENHVVPEEGDYLDLFQGEYNPVLPVSDIILWENKSIRPSPMNSRFEGIGFDKLIIWRNCQPEDSSEEEYRDEAKETLNKILEMYPDENRKPRRRRH